MPLGVRPRSRRFSRRGKFHAIRTKIDGVTFASKKEAARYLVLKDEQARGAISGLTLQPRYPLYVSAITRLWVDPIETTQAGDVMRTYKPGAKHVATGGEPIRVCDYVADFRYTKADGEIVTEDVKGMRLPLYKLKCKMVKAQYGITILET